MPACAGLQESSTMIEADALAAMIEAEMANAEDHQVSDEAARTAIHVLARRDGAPPLLTAA